MKSRFRLLAAVLTLTVAVCAMTVCLTSCFEAPGVTVEPADDANDTPTSATYVTRPTVATPEGQATLMDLMRLYGTDMYWSDLESFTHEMVDEDTARFVVADTYGKECMLDVTIDFESGMLTEATLYSGDVSTSILSDSATCFLPVVYAMNGKTMGE